MKIAQIERIVNNNLTAVKYVGENMNEFARLFEIWTDPEYLYNFFSENINDITQRFYSNFSVEDAVERTIEDAEKLEHKLLEKQRVF